MMAIGDFAIISRPVEGHTVNYYVEKEYAPYAKQIFGHTPQMIEFFSKNWVSISVAEYSQIVVRRLCERGYGKHLSHFAW